ncbi:potassium/sodium hyperpolarization-activated cyclic nucleotide-gated channel 4 [Tanacetum coccineum]
MRGVNDDSMMTVNAAVTAIQTAAENRGGQYSSSQKRRWGSCLNISWCFGSQKPNKRIGHVVPDPCSSRTDPPTTSNMSQQPSRVLPFIAPPSSPASFLHSEPPSVSHSPGGFLSFTSVSAHMYSPSGPTNIFAIGPYAHETQLVSPPVFSTYTTEPSTAPFTPPPESVHMTTPSSPEVPYARLLESSNQNNVIPYEFQSYQLYPGSPMGQLISPSSGFSNSGTSSPCGPHFLQFPTSGKVSPCPWEPQMGGRTEDQQHLFDHRVSFEVTPEQVVRCVERKRSADVANSHQKHRSTTTLGSVKEFNFDSTDGPESDWWTSEKVIGRENGSIKNWSFFPMMQPSVS